MRAQKTIGEAFAPNLISQILTTRSGCRRTRHIHAKIRSVRIYWQRTNSTLRNMNTQKYQIAAAEERFELYCMAHPGSPSAVRRPKLLYKTSNWVALLGNDVQSGIVGIGSSVEAALRAFDASYLNFLRPPDSEEAA
jgi:hypothetical protein